MAIIKCPECSKEISDKAPSCPSCGYPLPHDHGDVEYETSNITETKVKTKLNNKLIIITSIILIAALVSYGIFHFASPSGNAKRVASMFLTNLKQEDFFGMGQLSSISSGDLIGEYSGLNIISYRFKSVDDYEQPFRISHYISAGDRQEVFEAEKKIEKNAHPDFKVIQDDEYGLVLENSKESIKGYLITFDVDYSNFSGILKRNSVTLTVEQENSTSNKYVVSDIVGLLN